MNNRIRYPLILACTFLLAGFTAGCATVVTPHSTSEPVSTDGHHGVLVGNFQLAWHGTETSKGRAQPLDMKWSLEEETQGTRIVIAHLPITGPFVVKLPVGAYRVKGISFDGLWGTWHTVLPATFQVHPGGCTSLGRWELQRETESLVDWITGQVFKDIDTAHGDLQQALATNKCPTLAASMELSVRNKLTFHNGHGGLEF